MKNLKYIFLLFTALFVASCASRKDVVYFQGDAALETSFKQSIPVIQPLDMLTINVSAGNLRATEAFNQMGVQSTNGANAQPTAYTVNEDGTIDYPIIGKIKLAGLTRSEAVVLLKEKLEGYIINPGVNINFVNFKVSVLGEVASPGTFTLPNERITLLEALALAGDLTIQGKRENVMVIRETAAGKKTYQVDLTSKEALDSPVYYLAQNDVVYVEPNNAKIQSSVINYTAFLSVASIIISVVSILTR